MLQLTPARHIASELRAFVRERLVEDLGKTVLFATHDLREAGQLAHRVTILNNGRIAACSKMSSIKKIGGLDSVFRRLTEAKHDK